MKKTVFATGMTTAGAVLVASRVRYWVNAH
jgi:hypothetical protein